MHQSSKSGSVSNGRIKRSSSLESKAIGNRIHGSEKKSQYLRQLIRAAGDELVRLRSLAVSYRSLKNKKGLTLKLDLTPPKPKKEYREKATLSSKNFFSGKRLSNSPSMVNAGSSPLIRDPKKAGPLEDQLKKMGYRQCTSMQGCESQPK